MIITFRMMLKITLIEFRNKFVRVKKWRMLQIYIYINHVEEKIFLSQSLKIETQFLRTPNLTQYIDWPDTSGDTSWKGSSQWCALVLFETNSFPLPPNAPKKLILTFSILSNFLPIIKNKMRINTYALY